MVSIQSRNDNQYTGLKTGAVYTAMAGAASYGVRKSIDPLTKWVANNTRKIAAEQNNIIKEALHSIKVVEGSTSESANNIRKLSNEMIELSKQLKDSVYKNASDMFKLRKGAKDVSFLKSFGLAVPFMLGFGLLTDIGNNFQRKHIAPNATTKNGNEYTKVNVGKKTGLINGILSGAALMALNKKALNKLGQTPVTKVITLAVYGVGGLMLGAIADKLANNKAAKTADKAAA